MSKSNPKPTISDSERDALLGIKRRCRHFIDSDVTGKMMLSDRGLYGLAGKASVELLDRLGANPYRTGFYSWLYERKITSSKELLLREAFGFVLWAFENPEPQPFTPESPKWELPSRFYSDIILIEKAFAGQYEFDLPLKSNGKDTEAEILRQLGFQDEAFAPVSLDCPHGFSKNCPHGCHS